MTKNIKRTLVFATICLAMWQLVLCQYTLKWDAIDITLPWRYFTADALHHCILPWWNPFQFHGFEHGLIPETWYPIGILLGSFRSYDLYSLNAEYLIHIVIAAWGFIRLGRHLHISSDSTYVGALMFCLSGFFIGHSQHMGWIVSGAWLVHLLASFLQWCDSASLRKALEVALISFLAVSGGYVGLSIVGFYLIITIFCYKTIMNRGYKWHMRTWLRQTWHLLLIVGSTISFLLLAFWYLRLQIDRGAGLEGEAILVGTSRLKHLISILFPFASTKGGPQFWGGDQSVINTYFGLMAIPLLIIQIWHTRKLSALWIGAILSMSTAMAAELPVREIMNVLPLFDLFRMPALFRYFSILCLVLIACQGLDILRRNPTYKQHLLSVLYVLLSAYLLTLLFVMLKSNLGIADLLDVHVHTTYEAFAMQSISQSALLFSVIIVLKFSRLSAWMVIFICTIGDVVINTQLNAPVSIHSEDRFYPMQRMVDSLPRGYPAPSLHDAIGTNKDQYLKAGPIYRNTNTLYKRVGVDGYTPFQYLDFIVLENSSLYPKNLALPFLYLSKPPRLVEGTGPVSTPSTYKTEKAIAIRDFKPNSIIIDTDLKEPATIVINQNYHPKWRAKSREREVEINKTDINLMSIDLPAGKDQVTIEYVPGNLLHALIISLVCVLLVSIFLLWQYRTRTEAWTILSLVACCSLGWPGNKNSDMPLKGTNAPGLINAVDQLQNNDLVIDRFLDQGDLQRYRERLLEMPDTFTVSTRYLSQSGEELLRRALHSTVQILDSIQEHMYTHYVVRQRQGRFKLEAYNGFEKNFYNWQNIRQILLEGNNKFQSLTGVKYSATHILSADNVVDVKIGLRYRVRVVNPPVHVILDIQDERGKRMHWKSLNLELSAEEQGMWKEQEWTYSLPSNLPKGCNMSIFVWNPKKVIADIDNFSISVRSHLPDS